MGLSSTLASPFLPEAAPTAAQERPWGAAARRPLVWASVASLGLHLALLAALIARPSDDAPAQEAVGGTPALEIAYVSSDELNSVASEAAPAAPPAEAERQEVADTAPRPESGPPPADAVASVDEAQVPTVLKTVKTAPPKPAVQRAAENKPARPIQARRKVEKKPKPIAQPIPRAEQAGRGTERQQSRAASHGGAPGPSAAGGAAAQDWRGAVLAQIARYKQYPAVARDHNVTGTAIVAFTLTASGAVSGVSLARGSGSSALDQATLAMVRNAAPFPPAPAGARLSFTTAVTYNLR